MGIYDRPIAEHGGSKYLRLIHPADGQGKPIQVDVYAVLVAFGVTCPGRQQAIKKLLCAGLRGKGNQVEDLQGAMDALWRALELEKQRQKFAYSPDNLLQEVIATAPPLSAQQLEGALVQKSLEVGQKTAAELERQILGEIPEKLPAYITGDYAGACKSDHATPTAEPSPVQEIIRVNPRNSVSTVARTNQPTQPCCDCAEEYPTEDLMGPQGHIFCVKCRQISCAKHARGHEWKPIPDSSGIERCVHCACRRTMASFNSTRKPGLLF